MNLYQWSAFLILCGVAILIKSCLKRYLNMPDISATMMGYAFICFILGIRLQWSRWWFNRKLELEEKNG